MRDVSFLTQSLIAHRGYHDAKNGVPENSMLAFKRAIENNLIIELDVHILRDGKVVVFHDDNLKRMTGIDKSIKNMDYNEICKIYLQDTDQKIPLLIDVLKLVNGKVPLIIELKYDTKCGLLEDGVINVLKNYTGKYAIKSFNPFSVLYFKKHCPDVVRGQLASDFKDKRIKLFRVIKYVLRRMFLNRISKPDFISYDVNALPNRKVKKIRKKKVILGWTVRSGEDYQKAKKYCDNLICENIDFKNIINY